MIARYRVAFQTIALREWIRIRRIWIQTLVPPAMTMILYFVIFGTLIGRRIGNIGEYSYMDFIVPGLIMMAVIQNSYSNVVSSFFSSKFQKNIEEMLVAPVPGSIIVMGFVSGGVIRGLSVGLIVTIVSIFFTTIKINNVLMIAGTVILTSILFSLAGFLNALFARKFDDVTIVPTFILTPLTYLGGVFYSIDMLPGFWKVISQFNPILYMVNAFRYGFLGFSDIDPYFAFTMIILSIVILFTVNVRLMKRGYGIRT